MTRNIDLLEERNCCPFCDSIVFQKVEYYVLKKQKIISNKDCLEEYSKESYYKYTCNTCKNFWYEGIKLYL